MTWIVLALLCAFALASADAWTKAKFGDADVASVVVIRFGLTGLMMLPLVVSQPIPVLSLELVAWLLLLIPLELFAMWLYVLAIRDHDLAHTLPYTAFTPVVGALLGGVILQEQISLQGLIGILLVVLGAWWLNFDPSDAAFWQPWRTLWAKAGARYMLAVATIYGATSVGSKAAMGTISPSLFGAWYFVLIGLATLSSVVLLRPKAYQVVIQRKFASLVAALLMGLMVLAHFEAIAQVEAAYMVAVKRTSVLFAILYGAWLFGEKGLAQHLSAGFVMLSGVLVITFFG